MPAQDGAAVGDRARAGVVEAADHVEQGRLARAVWPDDADDLAKEPTDIDTSARARRPPKPMLT